MSACISSHGEYDAHEGDPDTYVCKWCHEFDETGAMAEIARLRGRPVTGMEHAIDRAARALWDYNNADSSAEWRDMAWDDMGGSEPSEERVEYELRARALADAGLLAPAPLREGGVGWYEVIHPSRATTHVAYVHEDGSIYFPEGTQVLDSHEFAFAAARGRAYRLVRADAVNRAEGDGRAVSHE